MGQVRGVGSRSPAPTSPTGFWIARPTCPFFCGWEFHAEYSRALEKQAGRAIPLVVGNDGNYGGVAEAAQVRGDKKVGVIMLAPAPGWGPPTLT